MSEDELRAEFEDRGYVDGDTMAVPVRCENSRTGETIDSVGEWPGSLPEETIDPFELALDARNQITLPIPHGETAPPIDQGTYATLPTFLNVSNGAAELTATATAGSVTVTVTATAQRQYWDIEDGLRGTSESVECDMAGGCRWTPAHSSDGQPDRHHSLGEPCYSSFVTVQWSFDWEVSGADHTGEGLEDGYMAAGTCMVAAEVQAVVDDA